MRLGRCGWLLLMAGLGAGCQALDYPCTSNSNCVLNGVAGVCVPAQGAAYCTFADPKCCTGLRWHSSAATGLASSCVTPSADGGVPDGGTPAYGGPNECLDGGIDQDSGNQG